MSIRPHSAAPDEKVLCAPGAPDTAVASSALGAAGVALVETEIQLYTTFQPARPTYDIGVDLRAISADGEHGVNLQVKASAGRNFNVQQCWAKIPRFLIVYVWELRTRGDASVYILNYREALQIIKCCAPTWLRTRSWNRSGGFGSTAPSAAILRAIQPYQGTRGRWRAALMAAAQPDGGLTNSSLESSRNPSPSP